MDRKKLNNSLYPLGFVLQYVGKKREELVNIEGKMIGDFMELQDSGEKVYRRIFENRGEDGSLGKADVDDLLHQISIWSDELDRIRMSLSEKSMVLEDISNILSQTEALTEELVMRDNLTESYNRYFYFYNSEKLYQESMEDGKNGMSLAFIDIDNFKEFNNSMGHEFGDIVLRHFTKIVDEKIVGMEETYLIRVGGDEFIVMNCGTIAYDEFVELLEHMRKRISELPVHYGEQEASVTISVGVANAFRDESDDMMALYRIADKHLYAAKEAGRNRVVR